MDFWFSCVYVMSCQKPFVVLWFRVFMISVYEFHMSSFFLQLYSHPTRTRTHAFSHLLVVADFLAKIPFFGLLSGA